MPALLNLLRQMLLLQHMRIFAVRVDQTRYYVEKNYKPVLDIDKLFVKNILLVLAAAGPLTKPQLAGVVGHSINDHKFFYTLEQMLKDGALTIYAISNNTKWYCVPGFTGDYTPLTEDDLREAVRKGKSKKSVNDVTEHDIMRPPAPVFGQPIINPAAV